MASKTPASAICQLDAKGRLTIPFRCRRAMKLEVGDKVDVRETDGGLVIQRHDKICSLCGETRGIRMINGRPLCINCLEEIKAAL